MTASLFPCLVIVQDINRDNQGLVTYILVLDFKHFQGLDEVMKPCMTIFPGYRVSPILSGYYLMATRYTWPPYMDWPTISQVASMVLCCRKFNVSDAPVD